MKHDELWDDTLGTSLPPGWELGSLAAMKSELSRVRARRRVARIAAGTATLLALAWITWPAAEAPGPLASIPPPANRDLQVRYLDDAELINHLRDAGIGVGIAGSGGERHILLVSRDGTIYRP